MSIESLVDPKYFPASLKSTYLNSASISLMYVEAAKAVLAWQEDVAFNGTINFDEVAEEDIYKELHNEFAALVNANPDDIAGGSSTTELMSSLAWAVYPAGGKNLVTTASAHPSTIYPWTRVCRTTGCQVRMVKTAANGYISMDDILAHIDANTAVVVVSMVEYRSGQLYNLRVLADAVHKQGGLLVVDATQAAGQTPIDVKAMGIDALVSSGYKWLCGPFGIAVMYVSPDLQLRLDPGMVGWRSHKVMWEFKAERLEFPSNAARFEAGTIAYGCALALGKSVGFLNKIGIDRIARHNLEIGNVLWHEFERIGGEIASPVKDSERSSIISVRFAGKDAAALSGKLNAANIVVSERQGVIRISPHLYNTEKDVERIIQVAKEIVG